MKSEMTGKAADRATEKAQRTKAGIFFALMLISNGVNWLLAHFTGRYGVMLAGFAPTMAVMAVYFMIYPAESTVQDPRKFSVRTWAILILAFSVGVANIYAFKHSLY